MKELDSYLVRLGWVNDVPGYNRFQVALREAATMVHGNAQGMARSALTIQAALVGAFAAIGVAAVGMVDKVAMADQNYRLLGLHMFMSTTAARSLKIAMDALGQPLENLTWDRELRERTRQLLEDQRELGNGLGPDFEENMFKAREILFQFTRLKVEFQYLGFAVVNDIMRALGPSADRILAWLRQLNDWLIKNLPMIAQKLTTYLVPILKDVWNVMKDVWQVTKDFAQLFSNLVGMLSGDATLEGTVSFDKFARSVEKVVHWLALATEFLMQFAGLLTGAVGGGMVGTALGAVIGGIAGIPGGPLGIAGGMMGGGALGGLVGAGAGAVGGGAFDLYRHFRYHGEPGTDLGSMLASLTGRGGNSAVKPLIDQAAAATGVDPNILHAMAAQESGQRQFDAAGNLMRSVKGALGVMQLMPSTAKGLGVNRADMAQNILGGAVYFKQLLQMYGGNVADALAAYNAGPTRVNQVLAGKATLPEETKNYVASILARSGQSGAVQIGSVTITIANPNITPQEAQSIVSRGMSDAMNSRIQRNLAEFQALGYSY